MEKRVAKVMSRKQNTVARSRWKLIYEALKKESTGGHHSDGLQDISIRRFKSFGILKQKTLSDPAVDQGPVWSQFLCDECPDYSLDIRQLNVKPSAEDLIGFNNTGNVCVWPAEEVLTYYCLKNKEMFESKSVCELGGGMTCLAGFTVACSSRASEVLVTDGNETSCENAETIAARNKDKFGTTKMSVRQLLWNEREAFLELKDQFHIVIAADCFFFDEYRQDLADTIACILKPGGVALMFAPRRGATLKQFEDVAQEQFITDLQENYDQEVWTRHLKLTSVEGGDGLYDEDLHYPLFLKLVKR